MTTLGFMILAPLGYALLTGYLLAKVRPVPIAVLSPFVLDAERDFDGVQA
jgi:hypothetical protein